MSYKQLDIALLGRLAVLLAVLGGGSYAAQHQAYGLALGALVLLLGLLVSLTRYLTRGQQALADFALALKYRDFTRQYPESSSAALGPLYAAFNQVNSTFRELRAGQEAQFQYLQTMLALLDTGIVSYDAAGTVTWVNEAFKQLLHLPYLKNIRALQARHPVLYDAICRALPGQPAVVKLTIDRQTVQLLVSATQFRLREEAFTLLAFKNVSQALADTETAAWQQLLRVMTHEIMNSVAPIASLADSLSRHVQTAQAQQEAPAELLEDVGTGIDIIRQRSEGLLRFARVYRDFSTLAPPQRTTLYVQALLEATRQLLAEQLAAQGIELTLHVQPTHLTLHADGHLLEQVLINLVLNAAQAVGQTPGPRIGLRAWLDVEERVIIEVKDNGSGIPADVLDNIFVPFFTTRPSGSGIGLSLATQIMQLHQGSIQVQSVEGIGSVFQLWFPRLMAT